MEWAIAMGRASQRSIEKNTVIGRKFHKGIPMGYEISMGLAQWIVNMSVGHCNGSGNFNGPCNGPMLWVGIFQWPMQWAIAMGWDISMAH